MPRVSTRPLETMTRFHGYVCSGFCSRRIVRYLSVGTVSFFLDAGSLWFAFRELHLSIAAATTIGFIVGLAFNFSASKLFTFSVRSDTKGQTLRYTALLGFNYLLTLIMVSASETSGLGYVFGKLCSVGLINSMNYFALALWVFATPRPGRIDREKSNRLAENDMQDI